MGGQSGCRLDAFRQVALEALRGDALSPLTRLGAWVTWPYLTLDLRHLGAEKIAPRRRGLPSTSTIQMASSRAGGPMSICSLTKAASSSVGGLHVDQRLFAASGTSKGTPRYRRLCRSSGIPTAIARSPLLKENEIAPAGSSGRE